MATTYADLKTEIADFYNRNDLTTVVDTFIDLCESEMQVECKNLEFEASSTVTVTAGAAALPADWLGARSVTLLTSPTRQLRYLPPDALRAFNALDPSFITYYTIEGETLRFADDGDGSVLLEYHAKFTPLSGSNTSNRILADFPAAYLFGSLKYAAVYCKDVPAAGGYDSLFKEQLAKINKNNQQRKYTGPLAVRPA